MKLNLFNPQNDFYIVECSKARIRGVSLRFLNNEIHFKKFFESSGLENLVALLSKLNPNKDSKILFLYDRSVAATFAGLVRLEKSNAGSVLTAKDFDNFVSLAVRQFFNRFREEAKRKLTVDETNVVLVNNRFLNLRIDGKTVLSPIGLNARLAELEVEQTFLKREFLDYLGDGAQEVKNIFHMELPGALRDAVSRMYPEKKVLLAVVKDYNTDFFSLGHKNRYFGAVSFAKIQDRGSVSLGSRNFLETVAAHFGVQHATAGDMALQYAEGKMSAHFSRVFQGVIEPEFHNFHKEISRLYKKEDFVLVLSDTPFLNAQRSLEHISYRHLTTGDLERHFSFKVSAPHFLAREAFSPVFLSGLIAYSNRTSDNYLNMLARERMKWLMPANSA